jgi:hypothetical protein
MQKPNLDTLRLVQVVFRHGDRAPVKLYPNYPNSSENSESHWPNGLGQLTEKGQRQEYELGRFLRTHYGGFISPNFAENEVDLKATVAERTVESLKCVLNGLFEHDHKIENGNGHKVNLIQKNGLDHDLDLDLPWPIEIKPLHEDRVLLCSRSCPRIYQLRQEAEQQLGENDREFVNHVIKLAGLKEDATIPDVLMVGDTIEVERLSNLPQPSWATQELATRTKQIYMEYDVRLMSCREAKRLRGGHLINLFIQTMIQSKTKTGAKDLKLCLYSAHDETLARFMNTLGIQFNEWPNYAASIMVELHENSAKGVWVEIFYRNGSLAKPVHLKIPGLEVQCSLDDLVEFTKDLIPQNSEWDHEAQLSSLE